VTLCGLANDYKYFGGFCALYFQRRKSIILKLALAGNELTFSCPAASLHIGEKGWTDGLNEEVRGKEKEKRQRGTETRYKIVLLEGDSLY
jgi:hypothetical protein